MPAINFFKEEIEFSLPSPRKTAAWIKSAIRLEGHLLKELNYIFCSDAYLLNVNQEYLNHQTLTDIITFDNRSGDGPIEADIFISIERVKENAEKFNVPFEVELRRVMIHGVMHLVGYSDKGSRKKAEMRRKEDAYLSLY